MVVMASTTWGLRLHGIEKIVHLGCRFAGCANDYRMNVGEER